jgi:hypothetical protein
MPDDGRPETQTRPSRLADPRRPQDARARQEELLDEALEETFPASDPIAPARIPESDADVTCSPRRF